MKKSELRQIIRETIQTELFGLFGKHDLEKDKFNKHGFQIIPGGNNGFTIRSKTVDTVTMGPFEIDNNGNIDKSDKNTSKLLKKAQGFDKETKSLIRTALQDSGDSDWERIGSFNDFA